MTNKYDTAIAAMSDILENDPKITLARIRMFLIIKKLDKKATTTNISSEMGMSSKKYFRKFVSESEYAGYIEKIHMSDDPSKGDTILYKLTDKSTKILKRLRY